MRHLLWYLIAGTKGGINRAKILLLLHDRPYNAHQLAKELELDYKTVRHHLDVLEKNRLIEPIKKGEYGSPYVLSIYMEQNYDSFQDIWKKIKIEREERKKSGT